MSKAGTVGLVIEVMGSLAHYPLPAPTMSVSSRSFLLNGMQVYLLLESVMMF